jgi:hypothetical protein
VRIPLVTGALLSGALGGLGAPLIAAAQTPGCGTVVASGLASPRGVAVADDGTVYVSESGTGGTERLPSESGEQGASDTRGMTGQISRIAPNGTKSVLAGNLPSYNSMEGATGPAALALSGGALWAVIGGAGPATPQLQPLVNESSLVRIALPGGAVTKVADLGAYERSTNPAGFAVDSNPYGLAVGGGAVYATDAGGNTAYRVNPANGQLSVAAVIPGVPLPPGVPAQPNPGRGGASEIDPVPTSIAVGADGSVYVGLLPGFPFPAGGAKIVKIGANGTTTDFARGLSMVVGLTVGPDRNLYVAELSSNFNVLATPPQIAPGRVSRVLADGRVQVVADGIPAPNGIAFDRAGNLYVTANSAFAAPTAGQVLRCDRVAAVVGLPRTGTGPARSGFELGGSTGLIALAGAGLALAAGAGFAGFARRRMV